MSHSLLLGGRIFDLRSGRAGGAGSDQDLETLGAAIDRLEREFGDRQGLYVDVHLTLQSDHKFIQRCWVSKAEVGRFTMVGTDGFPAAYDNAADLFSALRVLITRYSLEWTE